MVVVILKKMQVIKVGVLNEGISWGEKKASHFCEQDQ